MTAQLEKTAPQPAIECWAQGSEPELNDLAGKVVLIEVIQVNCPGCFVHALPEVIRFYENYTNRGLKVFAIATAFEQFEHNTLNNLQLLLQEGVVQGDPLAQLGKAGFLDGDKLPYSIPFSVAMDKLIKNDTDVGQEQIDQFILGQIPNFYQGPMDDHQRQHILRQAESYLKNKTYSALTFEMYQLQGTPSSILIDKNGILKHVSFGSTRELEPAICRLLKN